MELLQYYRLPLSTAYFRVPGRFQSGDDRRRGGHIDSGNGVLVLLSVLKQPEDVVADDASIG